MEEISHAHCRVVLGGSDFSHSFARLHHRLSAGEQGCILAPLARDVGSALAAAYAVLLPLRLGRITDELCSVCGLPYQYF